MRARLTAASGCRFSSTPRWTITLPPAPSASRCRCRRSSAKSAFRTIRAIAQWRTCCAPMRPRSTATMSAPAAISKPPLASERDTYARAAGERLRAYALADLGLVGNALEAARSGLVGLPHARRQHAAVGLQDAMSYTSIRIGDVESAFDHLQRSVELDTAAGKPIDGLTIVYNIASMLAEADAHAGRAAHRLAERRPRGPLGRSGRPFLRRHALRQSRRPPPATTRASCAAPTTPALSKARRRNT